MIPFSKVFFVSYLYLMNKSIILSIGILGLTLLLLDLFGVISPNPWVPVMGSFLILLELILVIKNKI